MPSQNVNGTTLAYTERGSGLPVVLLHGFPLDQRIWTAQVDELSRQYRVIALDQHGFGQSPSTDPFTMESLADDVHALLSQIGGIPFVLGGLSMGGYVALAYAKKYPADLHGLMLIDTRAEADTAEGKQNRQKMIELARSKGSPAVADEMMPKMLAADTAAHRPQLAEQVRQIMEACPPLTIEHALEAMRDRPDYTSSLASIPVPTLILVGEADAITPPAMAEAMNKRIPRSTLTIIRGAGHLSSMEQPEQVSQAMRQYLSGLKK